MSNQNIGLETLVQNAKAFGLSVGTARRFNGAVAGCPEVFQIRVGKELYGWFNNRLEARAVIAKAEAR